MDELMPAMRRLSGRVLDTIVFVIALLCAPGTTCAAASNKTTQAIQLQSANAQNVSGVWWSKTFDPAYLPVNGKPIPFTAEGRSLYEHALQEIKKGVRLDHATENCIPQGIPRIMSAAYPFQILQRKDVTAIVYEMTHATQLVFMDQKQPEADDINESFMGHSVGHWEGSTLVIDTAGLKPGWTDGTGLPHSEKLHVIQRLRRVNQGKQLENLITIEDPQMFTRPWTVRRIYEHRPDVQIMEYVCGEANRDRSSMHRQATKANRPDTSSDTTVRFNSHAVASASTPDFSGVWSHSRGSGVGEAPVSSEGKRASVAPGGTGEFRRAFSVASDGSVPPLQPWAADVLKRHNDLLATGRQVANAVGSCQPPGLPVFINQPYPYQIIQTPDQIVILGEANWEVRFIQMNQEHPAHLKPSWYGHSVGHWEGDTLVVDTVGQNDKTLLAPVGIPKTDGLHLIEHFRLINDGKRLEIRMLIDDPGVFTRPWEAVWALDRRPDMQLIEYICAENERDSQYMVK